MILEENKYKIKFKKAGLSNILSYVLIFNLFFSLMVAMMFNSITQERRSMFVDYINKEAMNLQAELNGYSVYSDYCFMYEDGARITSHERAEFLKNKAIEKTKTNIQNKFQEARYKNQMEMQDITILIEDSPGSRGVAKVKITIKYKALFRSPFNKEDGEASNDSVGKFGVVITDTATRTIENPMRIKNTK